MVFSSIVAWGTGLLFIGLLFWACRISEPPQPETFYTLTVSVGAGVSGSPLSGSYSYKAGQVLSYDYSLERGSWDLQVSLDSISIPGSGSVTMNQDHFLSVSAHGNKELFKKVKFWAYQIQAVGVPGAVDQLAGSHYDLLVLEPTRTDWSGDEKYFDTRAMVERLKGTKGSDGQKPKLVIAYIDIGEAEDWRWYWRWSTGWEEGDPRPADWPSFILTHDPDGWEGNFPVAYWDNRWKDIVIYGKNQDSHPYGDYTSIMDEVIKDGFDGVYLDWVEAFENEEVLAEAKRLGKDAGQEMIGFIQEIRNYAASRVDHFIIIQQNASNLCDGRPALFSVIDAIAQEGIWFEGEPADNWNDPDSYDQPVPRRWREDYLYYLPQYLQRGLLVFDCEYALLKADEAYSLSPAWSFIPYCTRTSLAALTTTPPPGYWP